MGKIFYVPCLPSHTGLYGFLKPSSLPNFQTMSTNQCLEPLVCSCCGHIEGKSVHHLHSILEGNFEKLLNKKMGLQGCQVASDWSLEFRVNRGGLRTEPRRSAQQDKGILPQKQGVSVGCSWGGRQEKLICQRLLQHQSSLLRSCELLVVVSKF